MLSYDHRIGSEKQPISRNKKEIFIKKQLKGN